MNGRHYIFTVFFLVFSGVLEAGTVANPPIRLVSEGLYEIRLADQVMRIDATCGARIISFTCGGQELLSSSEVNSLNYGSTLWLSPQKWGWPPPEILDRGKYEAEIKGDTLMLVSGVDSVTGCSLTKKISQDFHDHSYIIHYEITNRSEKIRSYAPWEVTRVPADGITFYPVGTPGGKSKSNLSTVDIDRITWFTFRPELVNDHQKLFRNGGEGWLAHTANGLLFIRQFPDIGIDREAPGETEVEIYVCKDKTYMELENQGAYQTLQSGQSFSWTVRWYLRRLPEEIKAQQGNSKLVNWVRKTIHLK